MPENTPPPPSPATPKRGHHGPDFRLPRTIVRQVNIVCSGCSEPITRYTLATGARFHRLRQYADAAQRGRIPSEGIHDPETCIRDAERQQESCDMLNGAAE